MVRSLTYWEHAAGRVELGCGVLNHAPSVMSFTALGSPQLRGDLIGRKILELADHALGRFDVLLDLSGQAGLVDRDETGFGRIEHVADALQLVAGHASLDMAHDRTYRRATRAARGECGCDADWWKDRRDETCGEAKAEPFQRALASAGLIGLVDFDLALFGFADHGGVELAGRSELAVKLAKGFEIRFGVADVAVGGHQDIEQHIVL